MSMETNDNEFPNTLDMSKVEIGNLSNKLMFICNAVTDDSVKEEFKLCPVIVEALRKLVSGADLDNDVDNTKRLVYKNIAMSIIQICYGLSSIFSGLDSFNSAKWPEGDQRLKFLAHLLKAYHQIKHGIIWDEDNDEVHDNATLPNPFFSTDALAFYGEAVKGTTGWSHDDLLDIERLEQPLLAQLFDADSTNFKDILLTTFDDDFPVLAAVLNMVDEHMERLREKLKSVDGTNKLLNAVGGTNLPMYSTPEGLATIPHYQKSDWFGIMRKEKKRKKRLKKRKSRPNDDRTSDLTYTPERKPSPNKKIKSRKVSESPGALPIGSTDLTYSPERKPSPNKKIESRKVSESPGALPIDVDCMFEAVRIVIGKDVFKAKCVVEFHVGEYILFSFQDSQKKMCNHRVCLKSGELKGIKHHIPAHEDTTETLHGTHCDMTIVAFCITPTESSDLKNYSSSNNQQDDSDDEKNNHECSVSVEFRDADDLKVRKLKRHDIIVILLVKYSQISYNMYSLC